MDVKEARYWMNRFGSEKKPFLFAFNFELTDAIFIGHPLEQNSIYFQTPLGGNLLKEAIQPVEKIEFQRYPNSLASYLRKFAVVQNEIKMGNSYLVNLTEKTPIATNLDLETIYSLSNAPFKILLPHQWVCFSPERFVKIDNGIISTYPMKGTIRSSVPNAKEVILNDKKETAEHATIVDLLRNDLSIIAKNVRVKRYRYFDEIQMKNESLLQVSSEIVGNLDSNYYAHLGDIIVQLLPAGSISGAPKASTRRIIQKAENEPRGYYTGVFGYFDGNTLDSGVLIRFIEKNNHRMFYRSGGGITTYSNGESEYQEILDKIYFPFQ